MKLCQEVLGVPLTVMETPLAEWIERGREKRFAAFRFQAAYQKRIPEILRQARLFSGRPYDKHYDLDDEKIYCSELIYKGFKAATTEELGKVQKLGELKWQPYEKVIKAIENGNVPLDRQMITPRSLSEARQLDKVYSRGF